MRRPVQGQRAILEYPAALSAYRSSLSGYQMNSPGTVFTQSQLPVYQLTRNVIGIGLDYSWSERAGSPDGTLGAP